MSHVLAYDIGTTGTKTCLYRLAVTIGACAQVRHPLSIGSGGRL